MSVMTPKGASIVLVVILIVLGFAFLSGSVVPYRLIYVLSVGTAVNLAIALISIRGLRAESRGSQVKVEAGSVIEEELLLSNRILLPRLFLEVAVETTLPGGGTARLVNLGPGQVTTWAMALKAERRGLYKVGPVKVGYRDPLGLFETTRRFGTPRELLVLPATVNIGASALSKSDLGRHVKSRLGGSSLSPAAASIRRYEPGEGYSRIHWPSTLRHRQLMSKELDTETVESVWVVVDLDQTVHLGVDNESTEEYAITIAASYVKYYLLAGFAVGLLGHGREHVLLPLGRGSHHLARILEALALAKVGPSPPLEKVLVQERKRIGSRATLIIVTPSTAPEWMAAVRYLYQNNDRHLVLLEHASFNGGGDSSSAIPLAQGPRLQVCWVRKGDNLSVLLSQHLLEQREMASPPRNTEKS
jgi:uncharacterized protein (DUF58 family)